MPKDQQTAPSTDDVALQLQILREDITALSHSVSELARDRAGQLRDKAVSAGENAKDEALRKGRAAATEASRMAHQASDRAGAAVREQPLAATAVAAGLGFVVGYLSNRR